MVGNLGILKMKLWCFWGSFIWIGIKNVMKTFQMDKIEVTVSILICISRREAAVMMSFYGGRSTLFSSRSNLEYSRYHTTHGGDLCGPMDYHVYLLENQQLEVFFSNFQGHDIRVYWAFYRLPESTLQVAKVAKLLHCINNGILGDYKGKDFDGIEFEEKLLFKVSRTLAGTKTTR